MILLHFVVSFFYLFLDTNQSLCTDNIPSALTAPDISVFDNTIISYSYETMEIRILQGCLCRD